MSSTTTAASLPDDENILREILLRLPPLPSTLPRASLVSKLWRRVISEPEFQRRFCTHHKTSPPLLGFFSTDYSHCSTHGIRHVFTPTLGIPDRIPSARFYLDTGDGGMLLGCRHGLVLLALDSSLGETPPDSSENSSLVVQALVWDPVANRRCHVDVPPELTIKHNRTHYHGAVLRAYAGGSGAFRLFMVCCDILDQRTARACVYESESRRWGNVISVPVANYIAPSVLIGNALYWSTRSVFGDGGGVLLRFDLDEQRMAEIKMSQDIIPVPYYGGLGFAVLSKQKMQLWGRAAILAGDNVVTAVLQRTVELDQLL